MTVPIRVAAIQLTSCSDLELNLRACEHWVERAKRAGARLAVLPEHFAFQGSVGARSEVAEALGDMGAPIQAAISGFAKTYGIALVAGGWPERSHDEKRPYNTATVYDASGVLLGHYRKIHLFDVELPGGVLIRESADTTAGESVRSITIEGVSLGASICYVERRRTTGPRSQERRRCSNLRRRESRPIPGEK